MRPKAPWPCPRNHRIPGAGAPVKRRKAQQRWTQWSKNQVSGWATSVLRNQHLQQTSWSISLSSPSWCLRSLFSWESRLDHLKLSGKNIARGGSGSMGYLYWAINQKIWCCKGDFGKRKILQDPHVLLLLSTTFFQHIFAGSLTSLFCQLTQLTQLFPSSHQPHCFWKLLGPWFTRWRSKAFDLEAAAIKAKKGPRKETQRVKTWFACCCSKKVCFSIKLEGLVCSSFGFCRWRLFNEVVALSLAREWSSPHHTTKGRKVIMPWLKVQYSGDTDIVHKRQWKKKKTWTKQTKLINFHLKAKKMTPTKTQKSQIKAPFFHLPIFPSQRLLIWHINVHGLGIHRDAANLRASQTAQPTKGLCMLCLRVENLQRPNHQAQSIYILTSDVVWSSLP